MPIDNLALTLSELFTNFPPELNQNEYGFVFGSGKFYYSQEYGTTTESWQTEEIGLLKSINFKMYLFTDDNEVSVQSWFDLMIDYGGQDYFDNKYNYYRDLIIELIDEKDLNNSKIINLEAQIEIEQQETVPDTLLIVTLESDVEYYIERNEIIESGIGDATYSGTTITISSMGKYTMFFKYLDAYKNGDASLSITAYTVNEPDHTYLELYNLSYGEKQEFWYQLKLLYGRFLFEAYYENTLETEVINLYNQAVVYSYDVVQPANNFSTTMIDISDVIGVDLHTLKPGDYVKVLVPNDNTLLESTYDLQIASVSKELRDSSNIQLEIQKLNQTEKLLEKLLLGLN